MASGSGSVFLLSLSVSSYYCKTRSGLSKQAIGSHSTWGWAILIMELIVWLFAFCSPLSNTEFHYRRKFTPSSTSLCLNLSWVDDLWCVTKVRIRDRTQPRIRNSRVLELEGIWAMRLTPYQYHKIHLRRLNRFGSSNFYLHNWGWSCMQIQIHHVELW